MIVRLFSTLSSDSCAALNFLFASAIRFFNILTRCMINDEFVGISVDAFKGVSRDEEILRSIAEMLYSFLCWLERIPWIFSVVVIVDNFGVSEAFSILVVNGVVEKPSTTTFKLEFGIAAFVVDNRKVEPLESVSFVWICEVTVE